MLKASGITVDSIVRHFMGEFMTTDEDNVPTAQFKRKLTENLLAGAAAGVTSGIAAALLAGWGLVAALPGKLGLTPAGAVLAFDLPTGCPPGWGAYDQGNGRFLIGAATPPEQQRTPGDFVRDARGEDLTARDFGKPGGAQRTLLSKENVPPIFLLIRNTLSGNNVTVSLVSSIGFDKPSPPAGFTILQSSDTPTVALSVMPPYIALRFCRKT
jgi:hypothetical protein